MNEEKKYPFNTIAVLWFQTWRRAIRNAKATQSEYDRAVFCRHAVQAQAQYLCTLLTPQKDQP